MTKGQRLKAKMLKVYPQEVPFVGTTMENYLDFINSAPDTYWKGKIFGKLYMTQAVQAVIDRIDKMYKES